MAGLDDLIQAMALNQKQQSAIAADDPYDDFSALGQQTIQASLSTPGLSSRERIIGAILGGIGGGISQGLSSDYRGRALTAYNDVLSATKNGNEIEQPSVLSPSIFAQAQQDGTIWKQLQADNIAAEAAKSAAQANLKSKDTQEAIKLEIAKGLMSEDPKKRAAAEKLGAAISGIKLEAEPISTPADEATAKPGKFGTGRTVQAKLEESMQRFIEAGSSPSAAADLASKATGADLTQNKIAAKKVEEIREKVATFDSLIGKSKIGVSGAGETGGIFAPGRNFLSKVAAATYSTDQAAKQTAQTVLDTVKPELVQLNKFAGAMTEKDISLLVGAGASSDQTPDANRAIIANMGVARDRLNDYADFMDTFLAERGDLQGAEQLWGKYREANPLVIEEKGIAKLNPNVKPWTDFDFTGGGAKVEPTTPTKPTLSQAEARAALKARGVAGY